MMVRVRDSTQNKVIVIALDQSDDEQFDPTATPTAVSRAAARPAAAGRAATAATARQSTRSSRPALVGPPPFTGQDEERNDSTHVNGDAIYGSPV